MAVDKRPLWLVHAPMPHADLIELWAGEAKGLGFTELQAGHLCFWRWVARLDPERIERREPKG